jgi:hypothetical protein
MIGRRRLEKGRQFVLGAAVVALLVGSMRDAGISTSRFSGFGSSRNKASMSSAVATPSNCPRSSATGIGRRAGTA